MKAAIVGATGFIGNYLIDLLKEDAAVESVQVLARKALQLPSKFDVVVTDMANPQLSKPVDVAFCALGTTMAVAGSKAAFFHVDHDLVLAFAKEAKAKGAHTFVLVSSLGADASSSNYYLKVKGEVERDVSNLGFQSVIIVRPSLLLGERKDVRVGELIGKGVMALLGPLMLGPLLKYRGIQGKTVAKAMLRLSKENLMGVHILDSDKLQAFG
jgi:uncharacterized protein YbjT (DUF2867 family)